MNVDGTESKQLTHVAYRELDSPNYSPDGTRIIFSAMEHDAKGSRSRIYTMDLKTDGTVSAPQAIEIAQRPNIAYVADSHPRFSPVGRSRPSPYDYEVWTAGPDGTNPQQVTHNQSYNSVPVFSPDGQWIAFRSDPDRSRKSDLWKVRPDGTGLMRLTAERRGMK
jgi:TolB protein